MVEVNPLAVVTPRLVVYTLDLRFLNLRAGVDLPIPSGAELVAVGNASACRIEGVAWTGDGHPFERASNVGVNAARPTSESGANANRGPEKSNRSERGSRGSLFI